LRHVFWVLPGLLAGSAGPDEVDWDLDALWRAGIRTGLTLDVGGLALAALRARGFIHKVLLLPDAVPRESEDIEIYRRLIPEAIAFLEKHVRKRVPTLVHCHAGKDRTGVVLACYLSVHLGLTPGEAATMLRRIIPAILSGESYENLVYRLLGGVV